MSDQSCNTCKHRRRIPGKSILDPNTDPRESTHECRRYPANVVVVPMQTPQGPALGFQAKHPPIPNDIEYGCGEHTPKVSD
jgi:hypothetical protein